MCNEMDIALIASVWGCYIPYSRISIGCQNHGPFWVPDVIRPFVFGVPKKRASNSDNPSARSPKKMNDRDIPFNMVIVHLDWPQVAEEKHGT